MRRPPQLVARTLALTFVTAMTSARAYRPGREPSEACAGLQRYSGTQFDPACVEALLRAIPPSALSSSSPPLHELLDTQLA